MTQSPTSYTWDYMPQKHQQSKKFKPYVINDNIVNQLKRNQQIEKENYQRRLDEGLGNMRLEADEQRINRAAIDRVAEINDDNDLQDLIQLTESGTQLLTMGVKAWHADQVKKGEDEYHSPENEEQRQKDLKIQQEVFNAYNRGRITKAEIATEIEKQGGSVSLVGRLRSMSGPGAYGYMRAWMIDQSYEIPRLMAEAESQLFWTDPADPTKKIPFNDLGPEDSAARAALRTQARNNVRNYISTLGGQGHVPRELVTELVEPAIKKYSLNSDINWAKRSRERLEENEKVEMQVFAQGVLKEYEITGDNKQVYTGIQNAIEKYAKSRGIDNAQARAYFIKSLTERIPNADGEEIQKIRHLLKLPVPLNDKLDYDDPNQTYKPYEERIQRLALRTGIFSKLEKREEQLFSEADEQAKNAMNSSVVMQNLRGKTDEQISTEGYKWYKANASKFPGLTLDAAMAHIRKETISIREHDAAVLYEEERQRIEGLPGQKITFEALVQRRLPSDVEARLIADGFVMDKEFAKTAEVRRQDAVGILNQIKKNQKGKGAETTWDDRQSLNRIEAAQIQLYTANRTGGMDPETAWSQAGATIVKNGQSYIVPQEVDLNSANHRNDAISEARRLKETAANSGNPVSGEEISRTQKLTVIEPELTTVLEMIKSGANQESIVRHINSNTVLKDLAQRGLGNMSAITLVDNQLKLRSADGTGLPKGIMTTPAEQQGAADQLLINAEKLKSPLPFTRVQVQTPTVSQEEYNELTAQFPGDIDLGNYGMTISQVDGKGPFSAYMNPLDETALREQLPGFREGFVEAGYLDPYNIFHPNMMSDLILLNAATPDVDITQYIGPSTRFRGLEDPITAGVPGYTPSRPGAKDHISFEVRPDIPPETLELMKTEGAKHGFKYIRPTVGGWHEFKYTGDVTTAPDLRLTALAGSLGVSSGKKNNNGYSTNALVQIFTKYGPQHLNFVDDKDKTLKPFALLSPDQQNRLYNLYLRTRTKDKVNADQNLIPALRGASQ